MEYVAQFENLKKYLKEKNADNDISILEKAFELADSMHQEQKRKSGEPFIIHPVAVATMLAEMDMDMPSIVAGMLHDVTEDTSVSTEVMKEMFG